LRPDLNGIWSLELPVLAEDDDELGVYDGVFGSASRGRKERRSWHIYGGVLKGTGVRYWGSNRRLFRFPGSEGGRRNLGRKEPTGGVGLSVRERGGSGVPVRLG
jgi:hypothetical protein